jgi:hypothetical protein
MSRFDLSSRALRSALGVLTCATLAPVVALDAQSGGANEWALDSTLAQHMMPSPAPGTWAASGTIGAQFLAGRTDSRGYDVDLIVSHSTRRRMLLRFDAEWRRADARLGPNQAMTLLDDTRFLALSAIPRITDHFGVFVSTIWRKDVRAGLESRTMAQVGPYWQPLATKRVQVSVAPFLGIGVQDNVRPSTDDGIEAFGGVTTLTWRVSPMATAEVYVTGHRVLGDDEDHAVQANASITAALTKHLALKVAYNAAHEGVVPIGQASRQHALTTGVTIAFPHLVMR